MCSPFFLTFLEMGWGALRVLLWSCSPSIGLACSLTPLLCLCCILCSLHGPEQINWFQKGAAIPSYVPLFLSPLPGKCCSNFPAWMFIGVWGTTMHQLLPAQASTSSKTYPLYPFHCFSAEQYKVVKINEENAWEKKFPFWLTHGVIFVHETQRRKTYYHSSLQKICINFFQCKLNFHCQHTIFTYLPEATFFNHCYIHFLIETA